MLEKAITEYDAGRLLPNHRSGLATRGLGVGEQPEDALIGGE